MKKVYILIFVLVIALSLTGCNNSSVEYKYENADKYSIGGSSFSVEEIASFDVDWISGDMTIITADIAEIEVYEESNKELTNIKKMHYWLDGTCLRIKYAGDTTTLVMNEITKKLFIKIPQTSEKVFDSLNINSVSGSVNSNSLKANSLEIKVVSGALSISNSTVQNLKMNIVSGNTSLSTTTINDLDINNVSGTVSLSPKNCPPAININSVSGDVTLKLPENPGFALTCTSISGKFSSEFSTTQNDNTYIYGDGSAKFTVSMISGDIKVEKYWATLS